jgi:glycosyltransferase involved in cell wall biosynthesis
MQPVYNYQINDLSDQEAIMEMIERDNLMIYQNQIQFPLVSCVVPTANRAHYLARSVQYFMNQEYPNKELIIVYNNDSDIPAISFPPNVKFVHCISNILGAKRNEGTRYAQGEIIAQWDDDDIYGPGRISQQIFPIFLGQADMTGLGNFVFFDIGTGNCYKPEQDLFNNAFQDSLACGTLVFKRDVWDNLARYPNVRGGEDYEFLIRSKRKNVKVQAVNGYNSFIYIRHIKNTWQFEKDNFRRYEGWIRVDLPDWASQYADFYDYISSIQEQLLDKKSLLALMPR